MEAEPACRAEHPLHDAGVNATEGAPRGLNLSHEFWGRVIVHPQEAQLLSDLNVRMSAFEFLAKEYRGTLVESPSRRDASTPCSYGRKLHRHLSMDVR